MIDSVRAALAVWLVLAHLVPWSAIGQGPDATGHAGQVFMQALVTMFQPDNETHPAVLCFIVLSGYCIHRNGLRRDSFDVGKYAIRRTFRIYPVYLIAAVFGMCCFLVATRANLQVGQELSGTTGLSPTCVVAKLTLINDVDPNLLYCVYQGNGPLNTVLAEMGLYALYPALLLLARRFGDHFLATVVLIAWIAGMVVINANPGYAYWWHHASVAGFLVYWWIGAALIDRRFGSFVSRNWYWVLGAWLLLSVGLVGHVAFIESRKITEALLFGAFVLRVDALHSTLPRLVQIPGKAATASMRSTRRSFTRY